MIVGAPKGNTTGIVASASWGARKLGVEEGMSVRQAQRACPDAVVVVSDDAVYIQENEIILNILTQYSPLLEPEKLGSAYLDVTASRALFGDARQIAEAAASRIKAESGLPVSIGLGPNKLLARVASSNIPRSGTTTCSGGICNPSRKRAVIEIKPGSEHRFLAPLPVGALWAVNSKIMKRLKELGVATVGQLAEIPERLLVRQFGPVGSVIYNQARGIDGSQVRAAYPPEIIIIEQTFLKPALEPGEVEVYLREIASGAGIRLKRMSKLAGELTLKLFDESGGGEECIPAWFRFKKPADSPESITQALVKLLQAKMQPGMEISRVQVTLSDLTPGASSQLCLIGDGERRQRVERAVELIRARFGDGSICPAASLAPRGRARVLSRIAA